jgi:hypothetical protein
MKQFLTLAALLLLVAGGTKDIEWQKDFSSAQKLSAATGKPMVLVFTIGTKGGDCCGGAGGMAQRFQDLGSDINAQDFIWVLISDKTLAQDYNVSFAGAVIICDPEGTEIKRGAVGRASTMVSLLETALEKYQGPLGWETAFISGRDRASKDNKLMLVFFEDGKVASKKTQDSIGSRLVSVHRKRLVYVKLVYSKESKECQELKVIQAPQIVIYDPRPDTKEDKRILGTAIGTRTETQLKTFLDGVIRKAHETPAKVETPKK